MEGAPDNTPPSLGRFIRRYDIKQSHVLPLTNILGNLTGIQFRSIHEKIKGYMTWHAPDFPEPTFFGLGQAAPHIWESEKVLLVEGAFDLFPCQRAEPATVATQTATLTNSFARLLHRLVGKAWFLYDRDSAGRKGFDEAKSAHGDLFHIESLRYPEAFLVDGKLAKDPADLWLAWGDDKLQAFLQEKMTDG